MFYYIDSIGNKVFINILYQSETLPDFYICECVDNKDHVTIFYSDIKKEKEKV